MADLAHAVHGPRDGPAVLLVHGFPYDRAMWRLQLGPLTAAGYRVVLPDLPGFGHSEGVMGSMDDAARDLVRLLDRLHVSRVVPVGFSMGGYVALALAAAIPDRLLGLALVDTRAEPDSPEGKAKRDATIADVQAHGTRGLAASLVQAQLTEATRKGEHLLTEEVRAMMLRQPKASVAAGLAAMRDRPDRRDLLPRLGCPVLALAGEHDTVTPPSAAKAMAEAAKDGESVVVAGAAHLTPMERPDDVNEALLGWLKRKVPAH
jgi:pimeloyl-ACP methyl ester carboxylesterase